MKNLAITMLISLLFVSNIAAQQDLKQQEERPKEAKEVLQAYEEAFLQKDLDRLMALYSEDAVFIGPDGLVEKGAETIRESLNAAFSNFFPRGMEQESLFKRIEGPVAYQVYSLVNTETGERLLPFATDTFVIRNGKIIYHTMAAYFPGMEIVESPYAIPVPEGWATPTISLPRYFAPELYEGIADYYFSPGMFSSTAEDYFTYAMVLWIKDGAPKQEENLERDLELYFDGLTIGNDPDVESHEVQRKIDNLFDSLSKARGVHVEELKTVADLEPVQGAEKWEQTYRGKIRTYDALVANAPLELYTDVHLKHCGEYTVMFVVASPNSRSHQVWNELNGLQKAFKCPPAE